MGDLESAQSTETVNIVPQDGCVILGERDRHAGDNYYVTRYRIRHNDQRTETFTLRDNCFPFADAQNGSTCCKATWSVLRSELFLFTMHMVVLALGVLKEVFYMREWNNHLHFIHTIVENSLCIIIILIRIGNAFTRYQGISKYIADLEHISQKRVHIRQIRNAMIGYLVLGMFVILGIAGAVALFYFMAHLGWTILTANFALVLMYAIFCLYLERLSAILGIVRADQHKAVIFECVLLLKEGLVARTREEKIGHFRRADRFLLALKHTDMFHMPDYIGVIEGFDYETIALKELETSV